MKFNFITLGTGVTKTKNGFSCKKGDWDLLKCFFEGQEFYLNINRKNRVGEIVKKDDDLTLIINE